jgi:hypothetical protein
MSKISSAMRAFRAAAGLVVLGTVPALAQEHANKANWQLAENSHRRTCGRVSLRTRSPALARSKRFAVL